jgi:hypothetical protein
MVLLMAFLPPFSIASMSATSWCRLLSCAEMLFSAWPSPPSYTQKETGGRWFARRPLAVGCYLVFLWSAARNCHGVARVSGGLLQDIE